MRFRYLSLMLCIFVAMLIVGCASPTTPVETVETSPGASSSEGESFQEGGTFIFPVAEEAPILNPYMSQTGWEALILTAIYEGLTGIDQEGEFYPILAAELPTIENGGVTEDGLTVTWQLRDDIQWSDGAPFTANDVKFTWEAITHPDSGATGGLGASYIESIEVLDDHTVEIQYNQYNPDYLGQFTSNNVEAQGILPAHACGDPAEMANWDCNRNPVGTGPFMFDEWRTGEYIKLVRNPLYRKEGKPVLDEIIFTVVPEAEVHKQMLLRGEAHAWFSIDQTYITELEQAEQVQINRGTNQWALRLFFNLSEGSKGMSVTPHPVLSDQHVRNAIKLAIDRNLINKGAYDGHGRPVNHELYHGIYECPAPEMEQDPETAKQLLTDAGWIDENGDGIRECRGCALAEENQELRLVLLSSDESQSYILAQQLVKDMLAEIGIEVELQIEESSIRNERTLEGDFDMVMWADGYLASSDPAPFLEVYFPSDAIPPDNWNIMRYENEELDSLLSQASETIDPEVRSQLYCQIDQIIYEDAPLIYILIAPYPDAFSTQVQGWQPNPNVMMTWDTENWQFTE